MAIELDKDTRTHAIQSIQTYFAEKRDEELEAKGVKVRGIVDHGWCQSIYFRDPNFLQLEFCCLSRELTEKDVAARRSESWKSLTRS